MLFDFEKLVDAHLDRLSVPILDHGIGLNDISRCMLHKLQCCLHSVGL